MEPVQQLIAIQNETEEKMQKAQANFKKSPKERVTAIYTEARLETLETYWKSFIAIHDQIITKVQKSNRQSVSYFTQDTYENVEELYYAYKSELKTALKKFGSASSTSNATQDGTVNVTRSSEVKLPRITIPTFSGNYTEWQSFHDLFSSLIHKNEGLEDVQKLHYLKSSLAGEADALLRQVAITGDNYSEAWSILKKRYDNKRYIANCIFKRFFGQRNVTAESSSAIKQLLDTSVECINALKNIGLPTEHWDAIVMYILVSKLDADSHKQWEETISNENSDELPKLSKLTQFLEMRFRTLEMVESANKAPKTNKSKTFHAAIEATCAFCKNNHHIFTCKEFAKQPVDKRYEFVQKSGLCFNCLIPNHTVMRCKQSTACRICHKRHHSLLHPEKRVHIEKPTTAEDNDKDQEEKAHKVTTHFSKQEHPGQNVLLATALVDVISETGKKHVFRALIDQGSQASFVSERVVQTLGLKRTKINGVVSGLGEGANELSVNNTVNFQLQSRYETSFNLHINAYVLRSLTTISPSRVIMEHYWPEIQKLPLADACYKRSGKIDILLGADVYSKIIDNGLIRGSDGIVAQFTRLGWILSGEMTDQNQARQNKILSMHVNVLDNDLLKRFWELESDGIKDKRVLTKDEELCELFYKTTTTRDETGRYIVNLPLKKTIENTVKACGNTKEQATVRFKQLEKRFRRNENLKIEYRKVIEEYLNLGHMVEAEEDENTIYLPHHAVVREDKDTTKVRVVFDASAKGSKGYSLNDSMLIGPTLQPDLRSLIIKWRSYKICIIGDIVKMYRQVRVIHEHSSLQSILWRNDPEEELKVYKLVTVTFGTAAAPYLAVRTLMQLADEESHIYPHAAAIVKNSFYMDDLMSGAENVEQALVICNEVKGLLKSGGFIMQKWSSNSDKLLQSIKGVGELSKDRLEIKLDPIIKILGLTWDRQDDNFCITVHLPDMSYPVTKRSILSDIARLFDPFGWLAPVIISAKIFIQKLWLCNKGWDDELPTEYITEWTEYRGELTSLRDIKIPRWINLSSDNKIVQIHGFSDASTFAYSAVVYIRVVTVKEEIDVNIIASKTKVAPLKQISIPRLELCGAVLLARLLHDIGQLLNVPKENVFAWTDSMVVLSWLQGQPSKWQTFVGNRVSEIIQLIDNDKWRHVKSSDNPADPASRGLSASELRSRDLWWCGPKWLKEKEIDYKPKEIPATDLEAKKLEVRSFHTEVEEMPIWEKFSSLTKMKRVLAYCRRFGTMQTNKLEDKYLTTEELETILERCIKYYQGLAFGEEMKDLKEERKVKKKSKLRTLNPIFDKKGILRVGGRLQSSSLSYEAKHPIIIPGKDHLTNLLVKEAHERTLHGGQRLMMSYLYTRYWIIGLKFAVNNCVKECVTCLRFQAKPQQQMMGQLPGVRVKPQKPFENSGVDYAGPIMTRMSKGRGYKSSKGYICLFICMCTKAIHLEVVSDLTAQGFLAAFRRFVARRGRCTNLWSDNGTNFVGAARELKLMFEKGKSNLASEIAELLATDGTTWHFIPPRAPNFGGLWEAGIRSAKMHLHRAIGSTTLTFEEMITLMSQIEACLNSRPLCQQSEDSTDALTPLTPGHFLVGEPLVSVPDNDFTHSSNINLLTRWQLIQRMTAQFWKRWHLEYLHTMQQRYKWHTKVASPKVDDVVIIKEEDLPPTKWLLGRVVNIHPGRDDLVRVVTIVCKGGSVLKRPLSKLIFLPKGKSMSSEQ